MATFLYDFELSISHQVKNMVDASLYVLGGVASLSLGVLALTRGTDYNLRNFEGDYVQLYTDDANLDIKGKILEINNTDNVLVDTNGCAVDPYNPDVSMNQALYTPDHLYSIVRFREDIKDVHKKEELEKNLDNKITYGSDINPIIGRMKRGWHRIKNPLAQSVNALPRATVTGKGMLYGGAVTTEGAQAVVNLSGSYDENLENWFGYGVQVTDGDGNEYRGILTQYSDKYITLTDVGIERGGEKKTADVVIKMPQSALDFFIPSDFNTYLVDALRKAKIEADKKNDFTPLRALSIGFGTFIHSLDPYKSVVDDLYNELDDLMTRLTAQELSTLNNKSLTGQQVFLAANSAYKMLNDVYEVTETTNRIFNKDKNVYTELKEANSDFAKVFDTLHIDNSFSLGRFAKHSAKPYKDMKIRREEKEDEFITSLFKSVDTWEKDVYTTIENETAVENVQKIAVSADNVTMFIEKVKDAPYGSHIDTEQWKTLESKVTSIKEYASKKEETLKEENDEKEK